MYGKGIVKGLGVTLKRFINTYVVDLKFPAVRIESRVFQDCTAAGGSFLQNLFKHVRIAPAIPRTAAHTYWRHAPR